MAKKVKTPEEVKAAHEKKSARRKLFFGTFTKALAFFLAIALTYTLAVIAFTPATTAGTVVAGNNQGSTSTDGGDDGDLWGDTPSTGGDTSVGGDNTSTGGDTSVGGDNTSTGGDTASTGGDNATTGGDSANAGDNNANSGNTQTAAATAADVAKALNDATAKAAKAGYHWARKCDYVDGSGINVTMFGGDATNTLNGIIQAVDANANLGSVVGGFIGQGTKEADVPKGATEVEGMDAKYMLKAMNLTPSDIKQFKVSGNTYMVQLNDCNDPQKDGKNPLHHATNDFIVHQEVAEEISKATSAISLKSSAVTFSRIMITAKIENGNLTDLQISYRFNAQLNLSLSITGTGKADTEIHYSNFAY